MAGRPEKIIDWQRVDELLEAENSGVSIAEELGMCPDTFYDKVKEKYKTNFSEYAQSKKSHGENNLKLAQYNKAIGKTKKGDTALLMFLGKTRLKQVEASSTPQIEEKFIETSNAVINMISQQQEEKKVNQSAVGASGIC